MTPSEPWDVDKLTVVLAVGLAANAQVCMRQWNPELIARKAREVAEELSRVLTATESPRTL